MRHVALVLPTVISATFGIAATRLAPRLPPRHATWLLSAGASVAAVSALGSLALVGFVAVGEQPAAADAGHWSATALRHHAPVGLDVASAALCVTVVGCLAGFAAALRCGRLLLRAYRACRDAAGPGGELLVVPDASVGAYAVPGRPGRIVVSRNLLVQLSAAERRALLAHERAHLDHGHHWHLAAVRIGTALDPLLFGVRRAAEHAIERWADEDAAGEVGDRRVVASALAKASSFLAAAPSGALAAVGGTVPLRVAALMASPPKRRPAPVAFLLLLLVAAVGSMLAFEKEIEHLFELAIRVEQARRGG